MTKSDVVAEISSDTGVSKQHTALVVDGILETVRRSLERGEPVFLRGFGSFIIKRRAEKTGRNIKKNIAIVIPEHNIPAFKPGKRFVENVKANVKVR